MKGRFLIFSLIAMVMGLKAQSPMVNMSIESQAPKYWYVADAKIACQFGNVVMSCLQVRSSLDSNWKPFQHEIEGFIWEPGIEVLIELEVIPIKKTSPDAPAFKYKYIRTVEVKQTVLKQSEIIGKNKWKLINIQSVSSMIPRVRNLGAWIQFEPDSGTVQGFGGCNKFGGNAEILEGEINFGEMYSTEMYCKNDSLERLLLESLKSNTQFYFRNNMLFITCSNGYTLHLRPEKRMDSLVNVLSRPAIYRGNTFNILRNGQFGVTLDDEKESKNRNFIFEKDTLTQLDTNIIKYRLMNVDVNSDIQVIELLAKPHPSKEISYAVILFKDGSRREIMMRHVL